MKTKYELPKNGQSFENIYQQLKDLQTEDTKWKIGKTFSLVYYPGEEILGFLNQVYALFLSANGLNPGAFPSLKRMENEVLSMVVGLVNGGEQAFGNMTSGGTESILMAVKAARDYFFEKNPNAGQPEILAPLSVHPAFDKAAHYFGVRIKHIPLSEDLRVDIEAMENMISPQTMMLVGSAPAYPHGVMDNIEKISEIALSKNIWFHVDACVGGMFLPFAQMAGYPIPTFDFRLPGVYSMSIDLHKYGYAAKGASVILYRSQELRRYQYFVYTEWPGGIYGSPAILGTRAGGSIAAAWAVMNHLGQDGYVRMVDSVMKTTIAIQKGIQTIPNIEVMSNPEMSVFAIRSSKDIYAIADEMSMKDWFIDRQQYPPSLHFTINNAHQHIVDELLNDLSDAVRKQSKITIQGLVSKTGQNLAKGAIKILPQKWVSKLSSMAAKMGGEGMPKRSAAMYGMMGSLPNRGDVRQLILEFMDKLYA